MPVVPRPYCHCILKEILYTDTLAHWSPRKFPYSLRGLVAALWESAPNELLKSTEELFWLQIFLRKLAHHMPICLKRVSKFGWETTHCSYTWSISDYWQQPRVRSRIIRQDATILTVSQFLWPYLNKHMPLKMMRTSSCRWRWCGRAHYTMESLLYYAIQLSALQKMFNLKRLSHSIREAFVESIPHLRFLIGSCWKRDNGISQLLKTRISFELYHSIPVASSILVSIGLETTALPKKSVATFGASISRGFGLTIAVNEKLFDYYCEKRHIIHYLASCTLGFPFWLDDAAVLSSMSSCRLNNSFSISCAIIWRTEYWPASLKVLLSGENWTSCSIGLWKWCQKLKTVCCTHVG